MKTAQALKENEIRPEDVFGAFLELSARDAAKFFDPAGFESVSCPGCSSSKPASSFKKHGFQYNDCAGCGSVYVSPRPTLAELNRYYATSESQRFWAENVLKKTGEKRKEAIMLPNIERIKGILSERNFSPERILDIGSANGIFLTEWKKQFPQATLLGIEPGRESAQMCRSLGIEVYENSVEMQADQGGVQGDLVTCFEVIEHVQDPARFVKALQSVTAPGGMCIISCLGADGFDIQVMWEKSRSLMPPYHLNFLSCEGMKSVFSKAGFKDVSIFTPGRLDVDIVLQSMKRGESPELSRFEKLLLRKGEDTLKAFQKFLAENCLSSHVWIVCRN